MIRYNLEFGSTATDLEVELTMIKHGGVIEGRGLGMFEHMMKARALMWPDRYRHSWTDLIYKEIIEHDCVILMGAASTGKTSTASEYAIIRYCSSPFDTLVFLSTTEVQKLETGVFGEVKMLWGQARERWGDIIPGNLIDHIHAIATDNLAEGEVRDLRRGIRGIACFPSGTPVDTPNGQVPIESLKEGDEVVNAAGIGTIEGTTTREADLLVRIHLDDGRCLDCTPEHPIFTSAGWKKAVDLKTFDVVFSADETLQMLRTPTRSRLPESPILFQLQRKEPAQTMQAMWGDVSIDKKSYFALSFREFLQHHMRGKMGGKSPGLKIFRQGLCSLWKNVQRPQQSTFLFSSMPTKAGGANLQALRETICIQTGSSQQNPHAFLQQVLLSEMGNVSTRSGGDRFQTSGLEIGWNKNTGQDFERPKSETGKSGSLQSKSGNGRFRRNEEILDYSKIPGSNSVSKAFRTTFENPSGTGLAIDVSRCHAAVRDLHQRKEEIFRLEMVQGGSGDSKHQTRHRNRRGVSLPGETNNSRPETRLDIAGTRVVRIEVLEPSSDERYRKDQGGYRVHNLHVAGHPSYSVNGVIVHNCFEGRQWVGAAKVMGTKQRNVIFIGDELQAMAPTFIDSWDNLFSNPSVKIIGSGNPWHNPDDQLGLAAEPIDGWASIGEPKVTTCWDTKFMGGRCVNLVGTDSPNFHAAAKGLPEPYPGLIGPKFAERTAHNKGINSPKYFEQVLGVMKLGMVTDRVITRQLCKEHHAHDKAVWGPEPRTMVHGLDPSYGGKDDCISVILEFGKDPEGIDQMSIVTVKEHHFDLGKETEVEAQLAQQVEELLKDYQIPITNSFYDPYGKGTMGFAFATQFGHVCPTPIDSGGKATERPVRQDLFVTEKNGQRRLEKCSEHYFKFVTEAWFSVRYVIEANQMRDFPESVMKEMCSRIYDTRAGKIEIEPKDDYKERTGRSPNQGDACAIAIEGARRLGFKIGKLGNSEVNSEEADPLRWLTDRVKAHNKLMDSKKLSYAT